MYECNHAKQLNSNFRVGIKQLIINSKLSQNQSTSTTKMSYRNQPQRSISMSEQQQLTEQCAICKTFQKGSVLWLRTALYARENNYHGRYLKILSSIVRQLSVVNRKGRRGKYMIGFREAMIAANDQEPRQLEYKKFSQIIQEIKQSITVNIRQHQQQGRFYFGEGQFIIMQMNQAKKRDLLQKRQNSRSQYAQKWTIGNRQAVGANSCERILADSTLEGKYEFRNVDSFEGHRSKLETSLVEIQKLKKNLSIMIGQLKLSQQSYPQTKNLLKPYIDFVKSKQQLKLRKKLQSEVSEIHYTQHQDKIKNKLKKSQNSQTVRLYTSPDLREKEDAETERRYAEAYGFLVRQNPEHKKKKKSLLRKELSREKSATNLSRTRLTVNTKASRQATEQGSQLMVSVTGSSGNLNLRKSKSRSKLGGGSKNKISLVSGTSKPKLRPSGSTTMTTMREKSLNNNNNNRSRKLLMQCNRSP